MAKTQTQEVPLDVTFQEDGTNQKEKKSLEMQKVKHWEDCKVVRNFQRIGLKIYGNYCQIFVRNLVNSETKYLRLVHIRIKN